ncbi:MAG: hypothetical protein GXY93_07555 [Hungateiclostridium saccincola]|nr:hypothetical protein [Acetivibrio saccincola]
MISLVLLSFGIYAYLKASKRLKTAVLYNDDGLVKECGSKLNFKRKINVFISERIDYAYCSWYCKCTDNTS